MEIFKKLTKEQLEEIPDVGPAVSRSVADYFNDKHHRYLIKKLDKVGVVFTIEELKTKSVKLRGKIFVLTGSLESMSRDEAKAKIRALGGEISESASKKTSYVIVGAEPGSKLEDAKKLGVKVINEKEFLKMLE